MLTLFSPEQKQQRVFQEESGTVWLHFKDLCTNLKFSNTTQTVDTYKLSCWIKQMSDGTVGYPPLWIKEEGAYLLMFEAQTLEAQNFKFWLATKVLPDLRKTGKYELKPENIEHFDNLGLSITEKAQKQIDVLLDQMANSTHDPLAINRYANAIQTLNDTIHRNQKTAKTTTNENAEIIEEKLTSIKHFLKEHTEKTENKEYKLAASKLYKAYCVFCKKKKYRVETQTAFGLEVVKLADKKRTAKGVFYFGITLK